MLHSSWITLFLLLAIPLNWVLLAFKFLFSPMSIPSGRGIERERELTVLAGIVLSTLAFGPGSVLVLIGFYMAVFPQYPSRNSYRPQLALSELAGSMLGFAMLYWLIFGPRMPLQHPGWIVILMVFSALPFALAVLGACNRADAQPVPSGIWRSIYVATFPLMIVVLLVQPLILLPWPAGMTVASEPLLQMAVGYALVILETVAGYKCRSLARAKLAM